MMTNEEYLESDLDLCVYWPRPLSRRAAYFRLSGKWYRSIAMPNHVYATVKTNNSQILVNYEITPLTEDQKLDLITARLEDKIYDPRGLLNQ